MAARIIVIGSGSIGRRHVENLTQLGAKVRALGWRSDGLAGVQKALTDGADGLVIATETQIRLPLIEAAAASETPFYVEKPLAFTPSGVEAMFAAAKPVAARSMLGYMMRYHPAFRALADADLSDTFRFDLAIGHDVTQWRQNWRFSQSYAARAVGGGVLLDLCHELDMATCLFPGATLGPVECLGHPAFPGVDMAARVALTAANGASGSVTMDYLAPRLIRRTVVCGTNATRDFDFAAQNYVTTGMDSSKTDPHPLDRNAMFLDAMRDFLALAAGREPSGNRHLPRFDLTRESCDLIARAHEKRRFTGQITKEIA